MTDLEYGRAWAKQMGIAPHTDKVDRTYWFSYYSENPVPYTVYMMTSTYNSEDDAYEAIGQVVRKIHREVPKLDGK